MADYQCASGWREEKKETEKRGPLTVGRNPEREEKKCSGLAEPREKKPFLFPGSVLRFSLCQE